MIKKLKSRSGLTLTELVITLFILTMFSAACLLGMTTAFSIRRDIIKTSDADILASTVTQAISSEIRMSSGVTVNDEVLKYKSANYGANCTMRLDADGRIKVGPDSSQRDLLSTAAYGYSSSSGSESKLHIEDLNFESVGAAIKVTFHICDESGHEFASTEFIVAPL